MLPEIIEAKVVIVKDKKIKNIRMPSAIFL